jgi:hypothetical protein
MRLVRIKHTAKGRPMIAKSFLFVPVALIAASPAAAEQLESVTSAVFQTSGSSREIARRANGCIAAHLAPPKKDAPLIVSSDLEDGTIVARNAVGYGGGISGGKARSRFTFEARDGRFRIEQTELERSDQLGGWSKIGKGWGSDWKKAEEAFSASASTVALCVVQKPTHSDW